MLRSRASTSLSEPTNHPAMNETEAQARIRINKLLEEAGWRFFDNERGRTNILLESRAEIKKPVDDDERSRRGFLDYLLLDDAGFPLVVVEAKAEGIHPLAGKEQSRTYAISKNCRFVILSNGNLHYFWDLERGNPNIIAKFPSLETVSNYQEVKFNPRNLTDEIIGKDYIVLTQKPDYEQDPRWHDEAKRDAYIEENKLRFLRPYQVKAVERIQSAVREGKDRFLFEMATGTGKTLTSAAVIKLFLRTGNARRVLFLVDRLELEDQADKAFKEQLKSDYRCVIYKENRDDWRSAEIVVSTVQSFLFKNKYKRLFAPADFDLIISDEAHRSIGGNARAVFEYFIGCKLGLTATPKDYLKKVDSANLNQKDLRELERRMLLDTYATFGCRVGEPTFRYALVDGVRDGYLINPVVIDARTDITTQLLSDEGYSITNDELKIKNDEAEKQAENGKEDNLILNSEFLIETKFQRGDFEKEFFSETTNKIFCETFLKHALLDPVTGEVGKTIVFCVSQNHAAKITQILNEYADAIFPGKYNSDFAVQVTSWVHDAQQFTINFTHNKLNGTGNFNPLYKTSKTRVCVTVGMMTTGYDCPDLLNVCLLRPIFSPTDFVQIKGRGTRRHNFLKELLDKDLAGSVVAPEKTKFKLFDFFANCEYFEEDFNYDEVLELPAIRSGERPAADDSTTVTAADFENFNADAIKSLAEINIGAEGMKIDRMMYAARFEEAVRSDAEVQRMVERRDFEAIEKYIVANVFEKPEEYYNLERLRGAFGIDRRLSLREMVEKIFGFIPYFKGKDELLEEEFDKFDTRYLPDEKYFADAKNFFKSYLTDSEFREIIETKQYARLNINPNGAVFRQLPPELRTLIPEYIKDNVSLNRFMS